MSRVREAIKPLTSVVTIQENVSRKQGPFGKCFPRGAQQSSSALEKKYFLNKTTDKIKLLFMPDHTSSFSITTNIIK